MDIAHVRARTVYNGLHNREQSLYVSPNISGTIDGNDKAVKNSISASDGTVGSEGYPYQTPSTTSPAVSEFVALGKMDLGDFIRMRYLERHSLTEDSLKALPDDEREAIQKEIAEEIKRELAGVDGEKSKTPEEMIAFQNDAEAKS